MKNTHTSRTVLSIAFLAVLLFAAGTARAQIGGASVLFLMIEPDSRSAGMGNSGVALSDNAYATFWNPASLANQRTTEASFTHSNWLPEFDAGLYYEYLVGKHYVPRVGTFGAHITYLHLGTHEGRDEQNNPTEPFTSYDLAAGLSYGFHATKNLSIGTSARFIYSQLTRSTEEFEASPGKALAFDVATLYRTPTFNLGSIKTTFSAGANLSNLGPKISYTNDPDSGDPIPTNLRFGYAFTFDFDQYNSLTLTNDYTKMLTRIETDEQGNRTVDPFYKAIFSAWSPIEINRSASSGEADMVKLGALQQLMIGAGAEYWYNRLFALRTGYFYENPYNGQRQFLTFGAGVRYNIVGIDFSYIWGLNEQQVTSETMRFSLLLRLSGK